jgi:hypothetical protein
MIRGYLLAENAFAEGIIGPSKPLLVVGAGAAGATAAMVAAGHGVPVTLIDRDEFPFNRQLACETRIIAPALYDWPAEHWVQQSFPWEGARFPFSWEENYAGAVATVWKAKLLGAHASNEIDLQPGTLIKDAEKLKDYDPALTGGMVEVTFIDAADEEKPAAERSRSGPKRFAAIASCVGWGRERSSAGTRGYAGRNFWDTDSLTNPDFGSPWTPTPRVLISGGGDGALQDFLRIATVHDSPRGILDSLPTSVREALADGIRTAEDQATRAYLWNLTRYDCRSQHLLHSRYCDLINRVLDAHYPAVQAAMRDILRGIPDCLFLRLKYPCDHFSNSFALNRALVLLIAEFVRREYNEELLSSYRMIKEVASADGHDCRTQSEMCGKSQHMVTFGVARCEDVYGGGAGWGEFHYAPYDVVVVRHGVISPKKSIFGAETEQARRQILPYYVEVDWY